MGLVYSIEQGLQQMGNSATRNVSGRTPVRLSLIAGRTNFHWLHLGWDGEIADAFPAQLRKLLQQELLQQDRVLATLVGVGLGGNFIG